MMEDRDEKTRRITKLESSVVNRIAAGEIIVQPANALKELLENSIDAEATTVEVLVKEGGLKLLQITDNGKGIDKEDMPMLCERFATSKLREFEDLETIATYGFRGEALASISHIARVSVVSKTRESGLAFKAHYVNGEMVNGNGNTKDGRGERAEARPTAGKDGTQITVEDIFYNVPSRLKTIKSRNEEFMRILDVIGRYAIYTAGVGISCKKFGDSHLVLSTRLLHSTRDKIRIVYGNEVANELLEFSIDGAVCKEEEEDTVKDRYGLIGVQGFISNANYATRKKISPIFFINGRLVSCNPLKRVIMSVYQSFLPKGDLPFVFLGLEIRPQNLDVNIHPTKREVRFLFEDEIMEIIRDKTHELLSNVDTSRKFKAQSMLSSHSRDQKRNQSFDSSYSPSSSFQNPSKKLRQENKLVRVDAMQTKLNFFYSDASKKAEYSEEENDPTQNDPKFNVNADEEDAEESQLDVKLVKSNGFTPSVRILAEQRTNRERSEVTLESIRSLRQTLKSSINKRLTHIFNHCSYIGIVDEQKRLCCFQYDVNLYMCDYGSVLYEFYYQQALASFANFGQFHLTTDLTVEQVLDPLYSSDLVEKLKPKHEVIQPIIDMKDMFKEYFQIDIVEVSPSQHKIKTLPMVLTNVCVPSGKLPYFFYRIGASVHYQDEKDCLQGILKQIALLYVPECIASTESSPLEVETKPADETKNLSTERQELNLFLEHTIFPMLKKRFLATERTSTDVFQIADLPGLYRVFERC